MIPKYRAWIIDKEVMVDVVDLNLGQTYIGYWDKNKDGIDFLNHKGFSQVILVQSTGFIIYPSNIELYSDDIIDTIDLLTGKPVRGVIKWENKSCGWVVDDEILYYRLSSFAPSTIIRLGNIHENKDLWRSPC